MSIILSRDGKQAIRLERTTIEDEAYLQRYIFEHPDALPLDQLQQDIRPLVLLREFPTPSGPIDALAVDAEANLYLIETKLYRNPDKRLVLAQVLDYGAALWKAYEDADDFVTRLDVLMQERVGKSLLPRLKEFYELDGQLLSDFLNTLKATVTAGRFRFVVLLDRVDDRLKDLIAYVNANSAFDILGVALDFYRHEDLHILIPTLHGAEAKKGAGGLSGGGRSWDADLFFSDAATRVSKEHLEALRSLHDWALVHADEVAYGRGKKTGSFSPKFQAVCARSIFTAQSDGTLYLNFKWLNSPPEAIAWRDCLGRALKEQGIALPADFAERHVSMPAREWAPRLQALLSTLERELSPAGAA